MDIEERPCGRSTFTTAVTTHTDPGGGFQQTWGATITTTYRAVWDGKASAAVTVRARPGVTLRHAARTRFFVGVGGLRSFEGKPGVLERFDRARGRWVVVKRFRFTDSGLAGVVTWSNARVPAFVKKGTLVRAVVPRTSGAPCYLAGYSNMVTTAR